MSIKEALDAQNVDCEAPNEVDASGKIANQIDLHQLKSSRSELADVSRHISRSDGRIGEENLPNVLSESQFTDVWGTRSVAADVNDEVESVEVAKQKSKLTQWWVLYQLDELEKKHSNYNKKIIRKCDVFIQEYRSC